MQLNEFRDLLTDRTLDFTWRCWGSVGLSSSGPSDWPSPIDPEALLLLTVTAARSDPRLFEEVADWTLTNEDLISFRRLKTLSVTDEDEHLVRGLTGWMSRRGSRTQRPKLNDRDVPIETSSGRLLFHLSRVPVKHLEPSFLRNELQVEDFEPSRKSRRPDLIRPACLAFRLRLTLGIGIRAELVRVMLNEPKSTWIARDLARAIGFSKRNTLESLGDLESVGLVRRFASDYEGRYGISAKPWFDLLEINPPPTAPDWVGISLAYRTLLQWVWRTSQGAQLSDYQLASSTSRLFSEQAELQAILSGEALPLASDLDYWAEFTSRALRKLDELTR